MMDGTTVSINLEYEEGNDGGDSAGLGLKLRHANVAYGGEFGKVTIGQGSEAGDASAYSDPSGVFGIGHGQEMGSSMIGSYFGSLDAGTRENMIRYDTPSIGPLSAAVSIGNGDRVSAKLALGTEFSGTSFSAQVATLQEKGSKDTVGASFGASLASGLTISGAWAKGNDHLMGAEPAATVNVDNGDYSAFWDAADADNDDEISAEEAVAALKPYDGTLEGLLTGSGRNTDIRDCGAMGAFGSCIDVVHTPAVAGNMVDPSYFQASIGYKFGNTAVAASWYSSEDFMMMGSEGTAIGIGVNHNLPKVGVQVYAAVQNYDVDMGDGNGGMMDMMDDTVFVVGTRVKF